MTVVNEREAALAEVNAAGHLVDRLLSDLFEAIKSVCVAGLAYPDPELSDELSSLAERARQLGMLSAVERLKLLRARLVEISSEKKIDARNRLAGSAWRETQKLLAWQRMMRVEHDLLTVQGRLAQSVAGAVAKASDETSTASLTAYPVGIDLDASGKLLVFAVDLDGGAAVLLRDHLTEFHREDPLRHRAISRLFQDAIALDKLLSGVLRLEDHPVVVRADAKLFRPAFRAIPRRLGVASGFTPPTLPKADLSPGALSGAAAARPLSLDVTLTRHASGFRARDAEDRVAVLTMSPTLRASFTKRVALDRDRSFAASLSVLPRDGELLVLDMRDTLGERCFPAHDPRLFALPLGRLRQWVEEVDRALPTQPAVRVFARVAVMLQGGASPDDIAAMREKLATVERRSLDDHFRAALASFFVGAEIDAKSTAPVVSDLLTIANRNLDLDLDALARVLGHDDVSAADERLIDGAMIHKAVWLALMSGCITTLRAGFETLWALRYDHELKSPTAGDVAARALLLTWRAGELPGFDGALLPTDPREKTAEAEQFLDAHLNSMVDGRRGDGPKGRKGAPMPELSELFALADTYAWVRGAERRGPTITAIGASRARVLQPILDALCDAMLAAPIERAGALLAADALVVALAAELRPYVVMV